ncbi:S41 family peptidase [Fulvivirga sp. RKSG066]|uniref:S41 family peptidase n=1 Tax=Fulvivirga aurantia TaxID=2529383 RepID=UPI0012BD3170|nr:S41 family peptidase [Fulvivirga aurantia]MTI20764.1 S41 family peptidase [Fulvivirga aurantia]
MRKLRILIATILLLSVIAIAAKEPAERYFQIAKNLDIFATLFKEVNAYYVDEVDPDKLIRAGIDSMLASLDPYTNYIPEEDIESFRTMTTGQYAGIGALIGRVEGKILITMPYDGFAAHEAGLRIGDQLLEIDGEDVKDFEISEISALLKGQVRTQVEVTVKRYGEANPIKFSIQREKITVNNVPYYGLVTPQIGYIRLEDFTTNAGKEVEKAVKDLKNQGAEKLILDLRDNPGGLLSEAVNVSNVFIPKGKEVVSTKGKVTEWNKTYKTLNNPEDTKIPLVVLADGGSASASEIVSGVIQDYDRGILLGTKTFGKGLVQTTRPLTYNSQLKVTTAKYYIPSGRCIQALDYAHRNKDGSASKVHDSLKVEYKTKNGRRVYDGEGLSPDIKVIYQNYATITEVLVRKGLIFEYATIYAYENEVGADPTKFQFSDEDYDRFVTWLVNKDYSYTTDVERRVKELESLSKEEKYYNDIKVQLSQLRKEIARSKQNDLIDFKEEIVQLLREEILTRKFLQKGAIEGSFQHDKQIQKAVNVLNDQSLYQKTLSSN